MKHLKKHLATLLFLISICVYSVASGAAFQNDYQAIDQAAKSVFLVEVLDQNGEVIKTGSGFVSFDNHSFITNHHVIEDAASLTIYSDQYKYIHTLTTLIAADKDKDIAILDFPEGKNYAALPLAPDYQLFRGQPVTAIGSPQGILNTVSSGNISSILSYSDAPTDIQFTAPISHGSSGGALFNEEGCIIGLVYAARIDGEALNYAIPIQYVIDLYNKVPKSTQTLSAYNNINLTPQPTNTPSPTPISFLSPPVALSISLNDRGYPAILWSSVNNANVYKVYRINSSGEDTLVSVKEVRNPYYTTLLAYDKKPVWNSTNEYYVIACNETITSGKSNTVKTYLGSKPTPTPRKTPTPTPVPSLPAGIKNSYQIGESGKDVLAIKKQMQLLGYYRHGASLGESYNNIMVERVKLFQENNGLEITGILDHSTLIVLFSSNAKKTTKFGTSPTPAPTKKAESNDPYFSLIIPDKSYGEWTYKNNNTLEFHFQVKNTAQLKTIEAFESYVYTEDVWNNRLIEQDLVYTLTTVKSIKPGKTTYSSDFHLDNSNKIRYVYAAIYKIKYSDGTVAYNPTFPMQYSCWTIE